MKAKVLHTLNETNVSENKWMNEAQVAITHKLSVTLGPQGLFICVFSALLLLFISQCRVICNSFTNDKLHHHAQSKFAFVMHVCCFLNICPHFFLTLNYIHSRTTLALKAKHRPRRFYPLLIVWPKVENSTQTRFRRINRYSSWSVPKRSD
jgi:hypothetical protein